MKNVFLDTETTGLVPGQIAELTMIIEDTDSGNIEACNYFFTVDSMDEGAQSVHGFSIDQLKEISNGKRFVDIYEEILSKMTDATLIAHNEAFDEKFLSSEFWRCGISFMPATRACTMLTFRDILKIPSRYKKYGPYKNPKLSEVIDFLNISSEKVAEYSKKLFKYDGSLYHDSRFDTTAMFVAINVYREKIHGGTQWHTAFCK